MKDYFAFLILIAFTAFCCHTKPGNKVKTKEFAAQELNIPYNLNTPNKTWWLPHSLQEISGITPVSDDKIACIQDEKGKVYIYNTKTKSIELEYKFAKDADYEDIHYLDGHFHILISNGQMHEFDYVDSAIQSEPIKTGLKKLDFEGLCLSNQENKFLIAPKKHNKLFVYDTEKNVIIDSIMIKNYESKKLKASAMTFDTISRLIYIISSPNQQMHILDYNYALIHTIKLDAKVFKQPEGMFISDEGDLYISNEGVKGKSNILKFNRLNEKTN